MEKNHCCHTCRLLMAKIHTLLTASVPLPRETFFSVFFTNQVASYEILVAMATKMVATWRVDLVRN